jgi:hypothetical protein
MPVADNIQVARSFIRNLHILLRQAGMFGLKHQSCVRQFALTLQQLREVLNQTSLLVGACGDQLVVNGTSLKPSTPERALISFLSGAGITSIEFTQSVSTEDLERLVRVLSDAKPGTLWRDLKVQLGALPSIHVYEFQLMPAENKSTAPALTGQVSLAAHLTANSIGGAAPDLQHWLEDPQNVIQLVMAAKMRSTPASAQRGALLQEEDVLAAIRSFTGAVARDAGSVGTHGGAQPQLAEASPESQNGLSQFFAGSGLGDRPSPALLVKIAEHLAVRLAVEEYGHGEVRINAVHETLRRMAKELDGLREVFKTQQDTLREVGVPVEPYAEVLERQFWAGIPDHVKRKVLLSPECWCIPPKNVRSFLEGLVASGEAALCAAILRNYYKALAVPEEEARTKAAAGIVELADVYAKSGNELLDEAINFVADQLAAPADDALLARLSAVFVRLIEEAAENHCYSALAQSMSRIQQLKHSALPEDLCSRACIDTRAREFVDEALSCAECPPALVEILRRIAPAAAEELMNRLAHCGQMEQRDRVAFIVKQTGEPVIEYLTRIYDSGPAVDAIRAVGLLTLFEMPMLLRSLADRVRDWNRLQQRAVVQQIAIGGAAGRGHLLAKLLHRLDRLVVPQAIDEIGMSGERNDTASLLALARGDGLAGNAPYLQLKAIEALGRLGEPAAAQLLIAIVTTKRLLGWEHADELRISALQSLLVIVPEIAKKLMRDIGFATHEIELAPLGPTSSGGWIRQRRYPRVKPGSSLSAVAKSGETTCALALEQLSLSGGVGAKIGSGDLENEAFLSLDLNFRRLQSHVVVHEVRPRYLAFEILDMKLDDRMRLRRYLATQARLDRQTF